MPTKFLFLIFFFICTNSFGQSQSVGSWELGISGGGAGYMGDLNQDNPLQISGFSAGIYGKRNFNQYVGVRLNYTYGQIQAKDANSANPQFVERNLAFKTSLNELSALVDFNFFNFYIGGGDKEFTPYLFTGAGLLVFNPKITYGGEKYQLRYQLTEGQQKMYNNMVLTIPYGLGVRYSYKDTWSVFSEIGYRTPLTDYIDDVSGVYPANPVIVSGSYNLSDPSLHQTGISGTQRGDFRKRDTYLFVSVGISFTFVSSKCYSF